MFAISFPTLRCWFAGVLLTVLFQLFCANSIFAQAVEPTTDPLPEQLQSLETGVWLVTYGPGEVYWQSFGHNGIWIRDEDLGLDHIFNFGFFDFAQEKFFLRFLQGKLLYFSAAQPAQREFAQYIDENRSIRLQKLALNAEQSLRLADYLVREVQPDRRDYLYDYFRNNCSTRVRDALDFALNGQLGEQFSGVVAEQNFRDHTRRLTAADFWMYLGLELTLGRPVDSAISRWDEFFIPAELADGITEYQGLGAWVQEDLLLYESSLAPTPENAPVRWPIYLLVSSMFLGLLVWLCWKTLPRCREPFACVWLFISGLSGLALLFFWFGTDHVVAASNINLLLFNPLFLLVLIKKLRRSLAGLVILLGFLALLQSLLPSPPGQYTADVLAAFLPLHLCAAWLLFRHQDQH